MGLLFLSGQLERRIPSLFEKKTHSEGIRRSSWPPFFSTQLSTTYCERARLKSSVKYLKSPSCLCAPPGCPQSGANRKSTVSLHSLGADLQRQFQLLHRLIIEDANGSANVHIISVLDDESVKQLKLPLQVCAEGVERNGAFPIRGRLRVPRRGAKTRR